MLQSLLHTWASRICATLSRWALRRVRRINAVTSFDTSSLSGDHVFLQIPIDESRYPFILREAGYHEEFFTIPSWRLHLKGVGNVGTLRK